MPKGERKREVSILPSGVSCTHLTMGAYDWPSIRHLAEKGVGFKSIAKHFKGLNANIIMNRSTRERWLTPARSKKMKQALAMKQGEALKLRGEARSPDEVMGEIWKERQAQMDEMTFDIASKAIKGVSKGAAKAMIADAKDLKTITEVIRKVTGHDRREADEADKGPQLAVNVNLLRSAGLSAEVIEV